MTNPSEFENRLSEILSRRSKVRLHDDQRRPSAVLIPIYFRDNLFNIVFTRRTQLVRHHKGEISFPGGAVSPEDHSLLETALRESFEEIGLAPQDVKVLGELDDILTRGSPFIITPFLGSILPDYQFTLSSFETSEIIHMPIESLLEKGCRRDETEIWIDGLSMPTYIYACQDKLIVGATARILKQFLEIYQQAI
jgi:8-oxo-dGTP pyrophosphatase MutT (NUDIX family)